MLKQRLAGGKGQERKTGAAWEKKMKTQNELSPTTDVDGRCLEFDFPGLRIGVAAYSEGPTGATVFWFRLRS